MGTGIGELCNTSSASVRPPSIAVCLMAPRRLRVFKLTPRQFRRSLSFYFTPSAPNLGQSNRFAKRNAISKTLWSTGPRTTREGVQKLLVPLLRLTGEPSVQILTATSVAVLVAQGD